MTIAFWVLVAMVAAAVVVARATERQRAAAEKRELERLEVAARAAKGAWEEGQKPPGPMPKSEAEFIWSPLYVGPKDREFIEELERRIRGS